MANEIEKNNGEIIIYQSEDGKIRIDVRLEDKTVWLTQEQIATLYGKGRSTITEHISNIFKDRELEKEKVCRKFRHTTQHGAVEGKTQSQEVTLYNLDVIISVGYRVKSIVGTRFRQWATERLAEYIIKGFTMDDERLKNLGGGGYWKELLDRIRDIRSSEKVMYRQVLDLYATSVDYDPQTDTSRLFFKMAQKQIGFSHTPGCLCLHKSILQCNSAIKVGILIKKTKISTSIVLLYPCLRLQRTMKTSASLWTFEHPRQTGKRRKLNGQ